MKRYRSKIVLQECIIIASKFKDDHILLAKNRDRTYVPKIKIVQMIKDTTEIAFIYDTDTGWAEGLNEYGVGITNTALMVGHDEEEKKIVDKTGQKSKDGKKIIKALTHKSFEDVVESVVKYKSQGEIGVKGHTFIVSQEGDAVSIELTSKHEAEITSLDLNKINARTNHGHFYTDAGYTEGDDYLSSKMRKAQAEKMPRTLGPKGVLNYLKKRNYKDTSNLNMNRNTDYMKTTGQILMDLTTLTLYYDALNGKSEFIEIDNRLPDNYEAKIKVVVYGDKEDAVEETKSKKEQGTMKRYKAFFIEAKKYIGWIFIAHNEGILVTDSSGNLGTLSNVDTHVYWDDNFQCYRLFPVKSLDHNIKNINSKYGYIVPSEYNNVIKKRINKMTSIPSFGHVTNEYRIKDIKYAD